MLHRDLNIPVLIFILIIGFFVGLRFSKWYLRRFKEKYKETFYFFSRINTHEIRKTLLTRVLPYKKSRELVHDL
jgi:hypothetical protein